jgi:hypothetical protein
VQGLWLSAAQVLVLPSSLLIAVVFSVYCPAGIATG